jgi:hypothetical protein
MNGLMWIDIKTGLGAGASLQPFGLERRDFLRFRHGAKGQCAASLRAKQI